MATPYDPTNAKPENRTDEVRIKELEDRVREVERILLDWGSLLAPIKRKWEIAP